MLLYIVRHGETDWNRKHRLQGQTDIPLNANGIALAEKTAEGLADVHFDLAISSPLIRAKRTAEIIIGDRNIPIYTDYRIREIGFGSWDGEIAAESKIPGLKEQMRIFFEDPFEFHGGPDSESIRHVCRRTHDFYQELIHTRRFQDKTILVATHGCAMRGIMHDIYGQPDDFWHGGVAKNCAVNIVRAENGVSTLLAEAVIYYDPEQFKAVDLNSIVDRTGEKG